MKNLKYLVVAAGIATLTLTSCGGTATTEENSTESATAETTAEGTATGEVDLLAESPDTDVTLVAYDVAAGETAATATSSITIFKNHTVSFTDSSGNTSDGFIMVDPYASGSSYNDVIYINDSATNSTKRLSQLVYNDSSSNEVTLTNATSIGYTEDTSKDYYGDLVMLGGSSTTPDKIYMMFLTSDYETYPEYTDSGDYNLYLKNVFIYDTSTKATQTNTYWAGVLPVNASDFTELNSLAITQLDESGNETGDEIEIGTFDTVYLKLATGGAVAATASESTGAKTYKALNTSNPEEMDGSIAIASDNRATFTDENGKIWEGFFFKDYVDAYTYERSTFFEFTDGSKSMYLGDLEYFDVKGQKTMMTQAVGIKYTDLAEQYGDYDYDEYTAISGYAHCGGYLKKVGTASTVAPNKIFMIYYDENTSNTYYESSGMNGGIAIVYDSGTGKFELSNWQTESGASFDENNIKDILITPQEGGACITISSFD